MRASQALRERERDAMRVPLPRRRAARARRADLTLDENPYDEAQVAGALAVLRARRVRR
jgi:hypothetical protein